MADRFHSRELPGYGPHMDKAALDLSRLTYDQQLAFIQAYQHQLQAQAVADQARHRPRLAAHLHQASQDLEPVLTSLQQAWNISWPHLTPAERGQS